MSCDLDSETQILGRQASGDSASGTPPAQTAEPSYRSELPWEEFGYESGRIPEVCEVCGAGEIVAIAGDEEFLGWCQECLDGAEENRDNIEVFR